MDITQLKAQYKAGERNFSGAQLSGVNLVWVELRGVNFQGADLSHANFSGANLSESDFSGETNLTFADLSRADLRNTNLKGTRLEGANLEDIQLEGAAYDETTRFPLGFDPIRVGALLQSAAATLETLEPAKLDVDLEQYASRERPKPRERETTPKNTSPRIVGSKPMVDTAKELFQKAISDWQETTKPTKGVSAPSAATVSSSETFTSNTSGQGKSAIVPASIKGWNWGALMLPGIWFLTNRVWFCAWIWILGLIPNIGNFITFCFAIAMAANGNTWAWQSRQWNSVEAFKKHQRGWAIAGVIVWGLMFWINLASRK
jgi:hypothetical protein